MSFRVQVVPSGHQFNAEAAQSVLDAALEDGLALPYGCRNGACRSCKGRVVSGKVDYPQGQPTILTKTELAQGWTLFCRAHPRSDLKIEIDEINADKEIRVRELPMRLASKRVLAADVVALDLKRPPWAQLPYLPGQYLDIVLRDGRRRAFSIANAPTAQTLELHIRVVPGGTFSDYAFQHLEEKAILRVCGPLGSFYLRKEQNLPVVFMAGGTGFAPVKSMIEDALADGYEQPMYLYWGARAKGDLYLHELAADWASDYTHFSYIPVLSDPKPEDEWQGRTGFVHSAVCEDFDTLEGYGVYMSGPPPMVDAGRVAFLERAVSPRDIHSDSFDHAFETGHNE